MSPNRRCGGFTLIEVMAALMVFVIGVLMVLRLSSSLTTRIEYSGVTSQLVVLAHEQMDSLVATPFDSLSVMSEAADFEIGQLEIEYTTTVTVSLVNPLLYQIDVDWSPKDLALGPTYSATTYLAGAW